MVKDLFSSSQYLFISSKFVGSDLLDLLFNAPEENEISCFGIDAMSNVGSVIEVLIESIASFSDN